MKPARFLCLALLLALPATAAAADDLETTVTRMARIGACRSPSFSPDGSRLAFVSNLNGVPQIWIVATAGGWPELVTALDDPVGDVTWSPDGELLAFSLAPGGGMNQQIYLIRPDGTDLRRITDGGKDNNWLGQWSHDGRLLTLSSNRRNPRTVDAYVYHRETGELDLVAENPGIGILSDLSRDGEKAVIWRMESRSDSNLFLLDRSTGKEVCLTSHTPPGSFGGGTFSPDGSVVYLSSDKDRDLAAFARVKIDAGRPSPIEILAERDDGEYQGSVLTDDGKTVALLWNVGGRSEMALLDLETLELVPGPEMPAEIIGGGVFSRDGRFLAMTLSGSADPNDIWVLDRQSGKLTQVTHSPHAGVDLETMVRPELVHYPAHDGLELSGWLYRPRGETAPVPFVLSFHGGPEGQARPSFRDSFQSLLSRGIGVFAPNVRGSVGFGKRFVNLDNGALRFDGIKDLKTSVDYLVENRIADPKRIGIMGGSYGGYMTMVGLTWYPDLFAAGACISGVVNFETFFANTEPWMAAISTVEYGDPETEAQLLRDLSPIHKVDQVRAPTLVAHGANDTNTPVVEAEQVVENLRKRGVPVEYLLFPDEGHGVRKTANRITFTVALVRWFERHLKAQQ